MDYPTSEELDALREQITELAADGLVVILGVGNELRGDDALGVVLAERLDGRVDATVIVTYDVPENYAVKVADSKPGLVLLLDAADMGAEPGSVRLIAAEDVPPVPGGTHRPSLEMFAAFVRLEADAPSYIVGVQPDLASVGMGDAMSDEALHAIEQVEELLVEVMPPA